ncbi:DoxX family protein [Actinomadura macrotermitis]|uniref:DoxX family protein n=1 Tax=Actinomadura macrotermitis TaxID=2585200 RepID=A0A7K0C5R0_9ACTN|nr:DoxX family protein [Actinomadura macrotermitis]MQY08789.1 hypothetical protein [Actinomadura macrotermitis]
MAATQSPITSATPTTAAADAVPGRRAVTVTLWTLQILLAVFLLVASALPKLAGQVDAVDTFAKIGWGQWLRYFTGVVEAAGAIGLVVPRLAGLAATGLVGLMIGAALTQVLVLEPAWAALPVAFGVVFAVVAWRRRAVTADLLRSLARR